MGIWLIAAGVTLAGIEDVRQWPWQAGTVVGAALVAVGIARLAGRGRR